MNIFFWKSELPADAFENVSQGLFDEAKRLSDFIGMIVRLGFLGVGVIILWRASEDTAFPIERYAYYFSIFCLVMIGIAHIHYINTIVMNYLLRNVRKVSNLLYRRILHSMMFFVSMVFYLGIWKIALELARRSIAP